MELGNHKEVLVYACKFHQLHQIHIHIQQTTGLTGEHPDF